MTRPRFAVHILAHAQPPLFGDLVASLAHPAIDVFAHIDAKSDQRPFAAAAGGRATFVPARRRVRVHWGGLSVVHATLACLRTAGAGYHRHSLLSGADLRLRELGEMIDRWAGDEQYLRVDRRLGDAPNHAWKVERFHFPDRPRLGALSGRLPRRRSDAAALHQGSNWWSLTEPAVAQALDRFAADRGRLLRRHRFSLCPDEYLFQSVLADTPFAGAPAAAEAPDVHGQHYIRWTDDAVLHPAELTEADLPAALASGALFARKVGPGWAWRGGDRG